MFSHAGGYGGIQTGKPLKINTFYFHRKEVRRWLFFVLKRPVIIPLFFLLRRTASNSAAAFCMIIVMLPFFLLAMYERHGQPLEVVAGQVIRCMFLRTKERPYRTNNFYAALERQNQAEKEVKAIVQKAKARAAGTAGGKTHGKANRRGKA